MRCAGLWILGLTTYAGYAWSQGVAPDYGLSAALALYGVVPVLLVCSMRASRTGEPLAEPAPWRVILTLAAIWLPAEFDLVGRAPLPAGIPGGLDAGRVGILTLALVLFLAASPTPRIGYTFRLGRGDLSAAALGLVAFAVVAIPVGLAIRFIHWGVVPFDPLRWGVIAFGTYFLIALPEELLFRGLLQNLLERRRPATWPPLAPLVVASVVFGFAHIDNPPAPNLRYVLLATLAGLAYGWVWTRTGKVTASALIHAAVDVIWMLAFRGG